MLITVSVSFETLKQKANQVNNERVGTTNEDEVNMKKKATVERCTISKQKICMIQKINC